MYKVYILNIFETMIPLLGILTCINILLSFINLKNQQTIMAKQDQINAILTEINEATTAISARLQALIDGGADNVTQESLDALQADADALKEIGTPAT